MRGGLNVKLTICIAVAAIAVGCSESIPPGDRRPKLYETRGRLVELADIASNLELQHVDLTELESVEGMIDAAEARRILPRERTPADYSRDAWGHAYVWRKRNAVIEIRSPGRDANANRPILLEYDTRSTQARKFTISLPDED